MAYTAIEEMRQVNERRFGMDLGPYQPPFLICGKGFDLKSSALRFIRERCEELSFDRAVEEEEKSSGVLAGKSLKPGQIPYNMEMDLNRLCLEKSLESFFESGVAEDAYAVYYCYLEMFIGRYGNSKHMVELLSEYEMNGSSLLIKHRDHYSHSVYVFALGLAIYETNETFRRCFERFYGLDETPGPDRAACVFLEFWGLTALFHDIGYPFEIPFEEILSYFEVDGLKRGVDSPYLAYRGMEQFTVLDRESTVWLKKLTGRSFDSISGLLAWAVTKRLGVSYGFSEDYIRFVVEDKPTRPERYGYFMDHAVFSAIRLLRELVSAGGSESISQMHLDALSAIAIHNSMFKFSIAYYKDPEKRKAPLAMELHPLAWMLMLCDELQCWDRRAYGRSSRTELHPVDVDFDFSGGNIRAVYYYDQDDQVKIDEYNREYDAWILAGRQGKEPRLKAYSDMAGEASRFVTDIEKIVDLNGSLLEAEAALCRVDRSRKHGYLSGSSFLHLYDFAVALHARNMPEGTTTEEAEEKFTSASLEYQLSGINRARSFDRYLNAIDCFYTDRTVDFMPVTEFSRDQAEIIAPLEHERWIREHHAMGWVHGEGTDSIPLGGALREQLRRHRLVMDGEPTEEEIREHYFSLAESDQDKDWRPFNTMLVLLRKFDGLRIYKLK